MNIYTNSPYFLIMDLVAAVVMAAGLLFTVKFISDRYRASTAGLLAALFILPVWNAADNYSRVDASRKFLGYDQPLNILRNLKPGDRFFAEEDFQIFDMMYIKQVKHLYPDVIVYDRTCNFLDTSIYGAYKSARDRFSAEKGTDQYDKVRVQIIKMLRANAEHDVSAAFPGKVYFADPVEFPQKDLFTAPYGMANRIYKKGDRVPDAKLLLLDSTIRDYFNNNVLDLYYRDVLARYFIQRAAFDAANKDRESFEFFKNIAEYIGGDSGAVLNRIAYIYYFVLGDRLAGIDYMEKIMKLNPYDYSALNSLISFCLQTDTLRGMKWLKYFYSIAPTPSLQSEILVEIRKIEDLEAGRGVK